MPTASNGGYQSLTAASVVGAAPITIPSATNPSNFFLQFLDESNLQFYNHLIHYGPGSQQAEAGTHVTVLEPNNRTQDDHRTVHTPPRDLNSINNATSAVPTTNIATTAASHASSACRSKPQ
jgi:hypothetical protein